MTIPDHTHSSSSSICHAVISLEKLAKNLFIIQEQSPKAEIVAMVKANAYGHGLTPVAQALQKNGVKHFGVATIEEGLALRQADIAGTLLLMGGSGFTYNIDKILDANLTPLISSLDELQLLTDAAHQRKIKTPFSIHLDLDTGMSRSGILIGDNPQATLEPITQYLKHHKTIVQLSGLATHFSKAESPNCPYSSIQLNRFFKAVQYLDACGFRDTVLHVAKSSAILTQAGHSRDFLPANLRHHPLWIRPGIALYGISPLDGNEKQANFSPVLAWKAPITLRKTIPPKTPVGYNNTWIADKKTEIALLRVGYGDGYSRQLSNQGHVLIQGQKAPILGRISMDLTVVNVTEIIDKLGFESCKVGTLVTLIGADGQEEISAQELGKLCHTISYEILTNISARVPRIYV